MSGPLQGTNKQIIVERERREEITLKGATVKTVIIKGNPFSLFLLERERESKRELTAGRKKEGKTNTVEHKSQINENLREPL